MRFEMTKEWAFFTVFMVFAAFFLLSTFAKGNGTTIFGWSLLVTAAFWIWSYG